MAIKWAAKSETYTDYSVSPAVKRPMPTYDGAVLGTTGRDVRIMSDVWAWMTYAEVWDGTKVAEVAIACSEDSNGAYGVATVDATPEVLAAVEVVKAAAKVKLAEMEVARAKAEADARARRVEKGKTVVVARGRKVAKGTTGVCIWMGEGKWGWRVGVKDAAGEVYWTALGNVDVVLPVAA